MRALVHTDSRRQKVRDLQGEGILDERGTADGLLHEYGAAVRSVGLVTLLPQLLNCIAVDEFGAALRSVGEVTLLPPATKLDSAAAAATAVANPALPIVETVL
jgi:hypothetical protein